MIALRNRVNTLSSTFMDLLTLNVWNLPVCENTSDLGVTGGASQLVVSRGSVMI